MVFAHFDEVESNEEEDTNKIESDDAEEKVVGQKVDEKKNKEADDGLQIEIFVFVEISVDNFGEGLEGFIETEAEGDGEFESIIVFNEEIKEGNDNHGGNGKDFGDEETFVANFGIFGNLKNSTAINTDIEKHAS